MVLAQAQREQAEFEKREAAYIAYHGPPIGIGPGCHPAGMSSDGYRRDAQGRRTCIPEHYNPETHRVEYPSETRSIALAAKREMARRRASGIVDDGWS
jgi:hypothetical protein